jgi:hypothetical protein
MPLNINSLSLLIFTNAFFTNNKDLLLQIGFVIILINYN